MLFLVTDKRMLLMIYRQLDVQSKHDDSGGTNTVLSFFLEHSADGSSWKYYKANGANKVPIQICNKSREIFSLAIQKLIASYNITVESIIKVMRIT